MNRELLVKQLDKATTKATALAIQRGSPISITKNKVVVGNLCICKNKSGFYDIVTLDQHPIYSDIYLFEVAIILAQSYSSGDTPTVRKVLTLQDKFEKHHTDMVHYLHCMKSAKKRHDIDRMIILEDKFQIAESHAKNIKDQISIFKRVK